MSWASDPNRPAGCLPGAVRSATSETIGIKCRLKGFVNMKHERAPGFGTLGLDTEVVE